MKQSSLSVVSVSYLIIASFIGVSRSVSSDGDFGQPAEQARTEQQVAENNVVNVKIFYESLCYDSIMFIRHQLVPTHKKLGSYMNVSFVPYGKAWQQKVSDGKGGEKWQFSCQHGAAECYGNKAQACGIAQIAESRPISGRQTDLVNFVGCVMSASNPATAVPGCLDVIGLDEENKSAVNRCVSGTKGSELLASYGDETINVQPTITFVPTIIFNELFSSQDQAKALNNFDALICQKIAEEARPTTCRS